MVFLRPLRRRALEMLRQDCLTPDLPDELALVDPNALRLEGEKGLATFLARVPDPHPRHGVRLGLTTTLAAAVLGLICGMRGFRAVGPGPHPGATGSAGLLSLSDDGAARRPVHRRHPPRARQRGPRIPWPGGGSRTAGRLSEPPTAGPGRHDAEKLRRFREAPAPSARRRAGPFLEPAHQSQALLLAAREGGEIREAPGPDPRHPGGGKKSCLDQSSLSEVPPSGGEVLPRRCRLPQPVGLRTLRLDGRRERGRGLEPQAEVGPDLPVSHEGRGQGGG